MASGFREEGSTPKSLNRSNRRKENFWRSVRHSPTKREKRFPLPARGVGLHMPDWMQWYDLVMIPLLILATVMVACNIQEVLLFFLRLTFWVADVALIVGFFVLIILLIWLLIRVGRRRRW